MGRKNDNKDRKNKPDNSKKNKNVKRNVANDREFVKDLNDLGLNIHYVEGDGNCLFRAIAHQLFEDESKWNICRKDIVKYITSNKDYFELFMEDDEKFDDYIDRMIQSGEWGGNHEIYAATQIYQVDIVIYQHNTPPFVCKFEQKTVDTKEIYLSYHGECHYNSICSSNLTRKTIETKLSSCIDSLVIDYDSMKISKKVSTWINYRIKLLLNPIFNLTIKG